MLLSGIELNGMLDNGMLLRGIELRGMLESGIELSGIELSGVPLSMIELRGASARAMLLSGMLESGAPPISIAARVCPHVAVVRSPQADPPSMELSGIVPSRSEARLRFWIAVDAMSASASVSRASRSSPSGCAPIAVRACWTVIFWSGMPSTFVPSISSSQRMEESGIELRGMLESGTPLTEMLLKGMLESGIELSGEPLMSMLLRGAEGR
jgi:hypothetical protein